MRRRFAGQAGFTLIETMVVVVIMSFVALLATQALPFLKEKTRDKRRIYELSILQRQIELYRNENGAYPKALSGATPINFFTTSDSFAAAYSPLQVSATDYVPGLTPNYMSQLPADPLPGDSSISGCLALGYKRNIAYFSDGENYKLVYHCASETEDYSSDSMFYDPGRPTYAWAASNDMQYTTFTKGW